MKLIDAIGGAQDERTKYQDKKKFPVAEHDAIAVGQSSSHDKLRARVTTVLGVMCTAAQAEHDAIKKEEAAAYLAANPQATAAPLPDQEDQSTGTVVGINPKGKIVRAGIGDSPDPAFAINAKTGAVRYLHLLGRLHNENPCSYGDLNGHYLGEKQAALLKNDTTGKYVAEYDAHALLGEDEILVLNPRSDAMYGAIGRGAPGKKSDWLDSQSNVEAFPEPMRPMQQAKKEAALARLPEAQKFIAERQEAIGREYAALLERYIKEGSSITAQGMAEAASRATIEINKKYNAPADEYDNDSNIVIVYDPKNPPENTIFAVVADGNGKQGYRVARKAVEASKKLFSPIPEVEAQIVAASERLSAESRAIYAQRHVSIPTRSREELAAMNAAMGIPEPFETSSSAPPPVYVEPEAPQKRTVTGWLAEHPRVAAAVGVAVLATVGGAAVVKSRDPEKTPGKSEDAQAATILEAKPAFQQKAGPQGAPAMSEDEAFNRMMEKMRIKMQKLDSDKPEPQR